MNSQSEIKWETIHAVTKMYSLIEIRLAYQTRGPNPIPTGDTRGRPG
jgi:hypothetical protein